MVLLATSAFFSGSETAYFSLNRMQKHRLAGSGAGRKVLHLLRTPDRLLSTILLGNTVVNVVASALAALILADILPGSMGLGVTVVGMTFVLLIFGEISPKSLAVRHAESWSRRTSGALDRIITVSRPAVAALEWVARLAVRITGVSRNREEMSRLELVSMMELGRSEGVLGVEAQATVSLVTLDSLTCKQAMVPRGETAVVRAGWSRGKTVDLVGSAPYSRFPVLEGTRERVVGYVRAEDILAPKADDAPVYELPSFPENASLHSVLEELRDAGADMGAVFDEYGDWVGIVTVEDIVGMAVFYWFAEDGELPEGVFRVKDGLEVPGTLRLEILSDLTGVDLQSRHTETCAGFVEESTGRIPSEGEIIRVPGLTFEIVRKEGPKLVRLKVSK
ncbi:DUF21 domain-containing protein [Candidatus Fermentibacteria bacterium]|nr:DUF21 domain-containing protein [Candidatus Fermentibacteria bacterium]